LRAHLRENLVAGMYERYLYLFLGDVPVVFIGRADEVVYLPRNLDAAEPAAYYHERQVPLPEIDVIAYLGVLHLPEHVVPECDSVAHCLEREGMVGHARYHREIHVRAAGYHDVVVMHESHVPEV